jgi:hypothetical protein
MKAIWRLLKAVQKLYKAVLKKKALFLSEKKNKKNGRLWRKALAWGVRPECGNLVDEKIKINEGLLGLCHHQP